MLNSIKNPKSNIQYRLQSTIYHPKSKICPTRHQLLVTRHSAFTPILQILSSCQKFTQNPKSKINNPLLPDQQIS